ncbi:hypothetical protein GW17_00021333 [Ensete ventricosum]|nr:hypothetical protein GW17_00021333 [Ensete ventricosum]
MVTAIKKLSGFQVCRHIKTITGPNRQDLTPRKKLYLEANPNRDHISWIPPPPGPPTTEKAAPAPVLLTETGCHLPRASDRHRHNGISRPSSPPVSNPEPRSSAQPSTPLDGDRNGHGHDQRLPLPGTWKPSSVPQFRALEGQRPNQRISDQEVGKTGLFPRWRRELDVYERSGDDSRQIRQGRVTRDGVPRVT